MQLLRYHCGIVKISICATYQKLENRRAGGVADSCKLLGTKTSTMEIRRSPRDSTFLLVLPLKITTDSLPEVGIALAPCANTQLYRGTSWGSYTDAVENLRRRMRPNLTGLPTTTESKDLGFNIFRPSTSQK